MPGTVVQWRKSTGTPFQLDPVTAAFNIGAMTAGWISTIPAAAEWGHPSDNLGGILATADWLSRNRVRKATTAHHADVLTA